MEKALSGTGSVHGWRWAWTRRPRSLLVARGRHKYLFTRCRREKVFMSQPMFGADILTFNRSQEQSAQNQNRGGSTQTFLSLRQYLKTINLVESCFSPKYILNRWNLLLRSSNCFFGLTCTLKTLT
ncbi:hypothetical protein PUN28_020719 [Cardiocondyla obscurior]|uniref:Uncharacterized protein n=1 Tax=Cardiocondyla obscurior TaxID=286306 RepID=A0AAW2E5Q4_9HYME